MDNEIDPIEFIESRAKEVSLLEESISKHRKKSQLFQRLPFFLRRRTQSYKPKKKRSKKKEFFLTYLGKRFFLTDSLPVRRMLKCTKFIYKSKKVFLFYECVYKDYFIFDCFNKEKSFFDESISFTFPKKISSDLCTDQLFSNHELLDDWLIKNTNNFTLNQFYYQNKFVCHKKELNKILFSNDFCLISLSEMFKLILERMIFIKYLNVFNQNFISFEKFVKKEKFEKNERRPLSKRKRVEYFVIMDYKYCCFFEVKRGNVFVNDKVCSEEEVIGRVMLVDYCHSIGRRRGVCWLTKLSANVVVHALSGKIIEIEIVGLQKKEDF